MYFLWDSEKMWGEVKKPRTMVDLIQIENPKGAVVEWEVQRSKLQVLTK